MKKLLFTLAALATASTLMADLSKLTLSFSTPGPDTYADGTPVAVGETYLLVHVANPAEPFAGVRMDRTLVNPADTIATTGTAVEGSKCGFKAIEYPAEMFSEGGGWLLVLLDTRNDAGVPGGLVAEYGAQPLGAAASRSSTTLQTLGGAGTTVAAGSAARLPAEAPGAPAIEELAVAGNTASLRIAGFADNVLYQVQTSGDLADWQPAAGAARISARDGVLTGKSGAPVLPAEVATEEEDTVRFFRVVIPASN